MVTDLRVVWYVQAQLAFKPDDCICRRDSLRSLIGHKTISNSLYGKRRRTPPKYGATRNPHNEDMTTTATPRPAYNERPSSLERLEILKGGHCLPAVASTNEDAPVKTAQHGSNHVHDGS